MSVGDQAGSWGDTDSPSTPGESTTLAVRPHFYAHIPVSSTPMAVTIVVVHSGASRLTLVSMHSLNQGRQACERPPPSLRTHSCTASSHKSCTIVRHVQPDNASLFTDGGVHQLAEKESDRACVQAPRWRSRGGLPQKLILQASRTQTKPIPLELSSNRNLNMTLEDLVVPP